MIRISCLLIWLAFAAVTSAELVTLSIKPNSFPSPSSVSVFVDAGLLGDDEVESPLSGEITIDLQPSAIQPTTAQITNLHGVVDNAINFKVGGGFLLPTVSVDSNAGAVTVQLMEAGAAAPVTDHEFSQLQNLLGFGGIVTTSVQAEPIDLSQQAPTRADFLDVSLAADRTSLSVMAELLSQISIPFDAGILSLEVDLDIEGAIIATGLMPAADYLLTTSTSEITRYDDPNAWLRSGVPGTNSLPISIDRVHVTGTESGSQIDLGSTPRSFESLTIAGGNVRLSNGSVQTDELTISPDVQLDLDVTTQLNTLSEATNAVTATGGGSLRVHGNINDQLLVREGSVGGSGKIAAVIIGGQGRLHTSSNEQLTVEGELTFDAGASLDVWADPSDLGIRTLVTAASIDFHLLAAEQILINGVPSEATVTHFGSGIFGQLDIAATRIQLLTTQAIVGDTDGSGQVDFADFLRLSSAFGQTGDWIDGDFDGSGTIEFADFLNLSANFGRTASTVTSVPEPHRHLVWLFACGCIFRWRRRQR